MLGIIVNVGSPYRRDFVCKFEELIFGWIGLFWLFRHCSYDELSCTYSSSCVSVSMVSSCANI